MNWFKHDTDCTQDAKIKKLLIKHGAVGYAIYFHCLELISAETSESNLTFELEHDSEIIADNLHIKGTAEKSGIDIVEESMRTIISLGLFQESEGRIFCFKLLKRLDLSMSSNPGFRKMIAEARANNHDAVMINHDTIMQDKNSKIRIARREESKRTETDAIASSKPHFIKPSLEQAKEYCQERGNKVDLNKWFAHYESIGWKVGKNPMKDWMAAIRTWEPDGFVAKSHDPPKLCPKCKKPLIQGNCVNSDCDAKGENG
jgi:hypothetical protein